MRTRYRISILKLFTIILLLYAGKGFAQVTINGPDCVLTGLQYQYIINTDDRLPSSLQICVTGGTLLQGGHCTTPDSIAYMILVNWKDSATHRVDVVSSLGDASLDIHVTKELKGGKIDSADKVQLYIQDSATYTFRCEPAYGGSCDPNYYYLWQRSSDAINWEILDGANEKDLEFTGVILGNTFFRRVVTETHSGIMAYSETAQLNVQFE